MSTTNDPIAEGRALAEGYNGAGGHGFNNSGKLNLYICKSCKCYLVTVDREPGVTPFITRCPSCDGETYSQAYRVSQEMTPTHEWIRPATIDGLTPATINHIRNGGLILRPIEILPLIEPFALFNWTAKRSGAAMSVSGVNKTGVPTKLGSIISITPAPESDQYAALVATDKDGTTYRLITCPIETYLARGWA